MIQLRAACCCVLILFSTGLGIAAGEAQPPAAQSSLSTTIRLAPALPSIVSEQPPAPSVELQQAKTGSKRKYEAPLKLAERAALAFALDSSIAKLSRVGLQGGKIVRLADALNTFGGKGAVGALSLAYFLGGTQAKRSYGTAFEAAGEAMLITESLKFLTGRKRPSQTGGDPDEFRGPGSGYYSFPSGHTSNAFAIATVLAHEHPKRKWLYYGLAAGVGLARIQKQAHFTSDVFVGATIGIYAGKKAVRGKSFVVRLRSLWKRGHRREPAEVSPSPSVVAAGEGG